MQHIILHDASGRQYCFPTRDVIVQPGPSDCRASVICKGCHIIARETTGDVIATLAHFGDVISVQRYRNAVSEREAVEHAEAINQRARAEHAGDDRAQLVAFGPEIVNAVDYNQRSIKQLPMNGPVVITTNGPDGEEVRKVRDDISESCIRNLACMIRGMDGETITRLVNQHREYQRVIADGSF